jgi:D-sedoheptulose 7-phosphate isomerase
MRSPTSTSSIDNYLQGMQTVLGEMTRDAILEQVSQLYRVWERRQQLFILGNGGSASTASHMANDLSKATIVDGMRRMKVISLNDNIALMTAWANDASYDAIFREQLENLLEPGDTVLAISASGNSKNVLSAVEFARREGAVTLAWTGAAGGRLKDVVDHCLHAPTDDVGMVESVHLVIDHLVTVELRQRIEARASKRLRAVADEVRAIAGSYGTVAGAGA